MATTARLLSVTLTASTTPLSASPRRRTTFAAALLGGFSSAVTTNSPDLRRIANALNEKDLSISERSSSSVEPLIFHFFSGRIWHHIGSPPVAAASSGRSLSLSG